MFAFVSIFLCYAFLSLWRSSIAIDTLSPNQILRDNGQTLVSIGESFELGFFSPWTSTHRFIGIWFKDVSPQTVVWVANKDSPLSDSSGASESLPQERFSYSTTDQLSPSGHQIHP
jgi:hypothetical protein